MLVALGLLLGCIFIMLLGVLKANNMPERIMSLNCLTNYVVVLLCLMSLDEGRDSFIDIAYIYVILGFLMNLGLNLLKKSGDKL